MRFFKEKKDISDTLETEKPRNQILENPKEDKGTEKLENKKANFEKSDSNKKNSEADGDTTKGQRERAIYNADEKLPEKGNNEKINKNAWEKTQYTSSNNFKDRLKVNLSENKKENPGKDNSESRVRNGKSLEEDGR